MDSLSGVKSPSHMCSTEPNCPQSSPTEENHPHDAHSALIETKKERIVMIWLFWWLGLMHHRGGSKAAWFV